MSKVVFLLKDNNEDMSRLIIELESDSFTCYGLYYKEMFEFIVNNKIALTYKNYLIIGAEEIINANSPEILAFIKDEFKIDTLNYVIITQNPETHKNCQELLQGVTFYYKDTITDKEFTSEAMITMIEALFQKNTLTRWTNRYIIESFGHMADAEVMRSQKEEIERLYNQLTELSKIDYLTKIYNRKAIYDLLETERKRTIRDLWRISNTKNTQISVDYNSEPKGDIFEHFGTFSCMMIDIDYFKHINDTYGHLVGDMVLVRLGELLATSGLLREVDFSGRFGGEEFLVILPETNSKHAVIPAERLREQIKTVCFVSLDGQSFNISISIGISEFLPDDNNNEDIIKRADEALYYAKRNGRDRVVIFDEI